MDAWMIWILLAVILAARRGHVAELLPRAVRGRRGARGARRLAGLGSVAAWIVFLVSSILLLGFVRPIARRHMRTPPQIRTGTAALVCRTALVTQRVDADAGTVKLEGEIWTARPYDDGEVIEAGRRGARHRDPRRHRARECQ